MRAVVALSILCLSACGGDVVTEFPPGLEPLETNVAPEPPSDGTPWSEILSVATGQKRDDTHWTHARAYVRAPIERTWAALADPEVVVDRRKVEEWSVASNVEPGFDVSYLIHNKVVHVLTVDFDITWRQSALEGRRERPSVVAVRYQKTFGTSFIENLSGSIILHRIDDETTAIELIEHLKSATEKDAGESYIRDLYASVVARAHEQPLPTYD